MKSEVLGFDLRNSVLYKHQRIRTFGLHPRRQVKHLITATKIDTYSLWRGDNMTQRAAKHLKNLCETTRKYSAEVEAKLSKVSGDRANEAFVESAAKYYPALKKLAKK